MRRKAVLLFGVNLLLGCAIAMGQQSSQGIDADIQLMRKDLRSQKKAIVAENMSLTETEATKFWPVYDQYTAELTKINDTKVSVIKEYAAKYPNVTPEEAQGLVKRWSEADSATVELRLKYTQKFQDLLQNVKAARFFQLDRRIGLILDLQLASEVPLVE